MEDNVEWVVAELATEGTVEMIRLKGIGSSGANWEALSPVNTSSKDLPFRRSRWLWNTFTPKGCIFARQLVCIKTLEVRLEYLFRMSRSSWAEIPSKSPVNFRWRFSLFLWIEILKFVAMMIPRFKPNMPGVRRWCPAGSMECNWPKRVMRLFLASEAFPPNIGGIISGSYAQGKPSPSPFPLKTVLPNEGSHEASNKTDTKPCEESYHFFHPIFIL
jgi:hypothetical protein